MKNWIALIAFLVVITIILSAVKPTLHKPFVIVETQYGVKTQVAESVAEKEWTFLIRDEEREIARAYIAFQ